MSEKNASRSRQALLFAQNFIKHPKMIGSFIPSSKFLVEHLMSEIEWSKAKVIVEYGPGVGTITGQLLENMMPDARLVVIEMNSDFVQFLRANFRDPRLTIVHGSAADVGETLAQLGIEAADIVISGIPFTTMPSSVRMKILSESRRALRPDGKLIVFQFTKAVAPDLHSVFGTVRHGFEPLNILPARLFFCEP